ncbi:MAG: 26S proteasome regulatory subunit N7, RPN7/PSMD6 [Amphiamblys sp. WSBS2006]|nr:MAG: 26S proteasome regulatory subunit N7, RPN7/PSMD6 [Amphiamblys sp. WSBS2006]
MEDQKNFRITSLTCREILIPAEKETNTVADLKQKIREKTDVSPERQILVFKGEILDDSLGIHEAVPDVFDCTICLFLVEEATAALGIGKTIEDAKDWETRNRLKAYLGVYSMHRAEFKQAASLLRETLSVFASEEFMPHSRIARYIVLTGCIALSRKELERLCGEPEIIETAGENKELLSVAKALYTCNYKEAFPCLLDLHDAVLQTDWVICDHRKQILRELRIKIYAQALEAYDNIPFSTLSEMLGLSEEFLEKEICLFATHGHISYTINRKERCFARKEDCSSLREYEGLVAAAEKLAGQIERHAHYLSIE